MSTTQVAAALVDTQDAQDDALLAELIAMRDERDAAIAAKNAAEVALAAAAKPVALPVKLLATAHVSVGEPNMRWSDGEGGFAFLPRGNVCAIERTWFAVGMRNDKSAVAYEVRDTHLASLAEAIAIALA